MLATLRVIVCCVTRPHRGIFLRLGTMVLVAGLLTDVLLVPTAQASLGGCNNDPIVVLSNGVALDIHTAIDDAPSGVEQVDYILHAPTGLQVVAVFHTPGVMGARESLRYYADNPPQTYDVVTMVHTTQPAVNVEATTTVASVTDLPKMASVSGQNHQRLHVHITL